MRRSTSALTAAVLGTALSATLLKAQQSPPDGRSGMPDNSSFAVPGMSASRGARYLLRNGWDYLKYQQYERALNFFREAEGRKTELNDAERQALAQGIENARRGLREASDGSTKPSYARSGAMPRPGSFALGRTSPSQRPSQAAPAPASQQPSAEPIQLTAGTVDNSASGRPTPPTAAVELPPLPADGMPEASQPPPALPDSLPGLPTGPAPALAPAQPAASPDRGLAIRAQTQAPAADPSTPPPAIPDPTALTVEPAAPAAAAPARAMTPAGTPEPASSEPAPGSSLAVLPSTGGKPVDLDSVALPPLSNEPEGGVSAGAALGAPSGPRPATPAPAPDMPPLPAQGPSSSSELPSLPGAEMPSSPSPAPAAEVPAASPAPAEAVPAAVVPAAEPPAPPAEPTPPPIPSAADESPLPSLPSTTYPGAGEPAPQPPSAAGDSFLPGRGAMGESTLSPDQQREVQRIAERQEEDLRRNGPPDRATPGPMNSTVRGASPTTRLEISRAPSPTEARPIRAIPVPDEFVPLPRREWEPNRKYWSAAAACHMPLYFQDAPLERYGQSVEQSLGTSGRFFAYPVDDPTQSTQRNQVLQPFASIGLFAAQIALLPYNLVMDPPWEAEYDLGYYRPGDRIPNDLIYVPATGVGPPLHGKKY